jgi:tricorn protease
MFRFLLLCVISLMSISSAFAEPAIGYYRFPSIHGDTIVFAAEGDLWSVSIEGGVARRLTTHPGEESHPAISPDGRTLAFTARYEGPAELYTMPLLGGLPTRQTYEAESSRATTWTPGGELVYTTSHFSTLPDYELVAINLENGTRNRIPLSEASEGTFNASGTTLFFVRPSYHRNVTKRYVGGTARKIWKFVDGAPEAEALTADYPGGSHTPMSWEDRVYFITDRDGTMNVWSMDENGGDLRQHTRHSGWDVRDADLHNGRIVYQSGADLWLYDIGADQTRILSITLSSDFDQLRENWVEKPMQYLTSAHIHPKGESVVLTARGRVFVAPAKQGRRLRASPKPGVRYRDGVFMPDGDDVLVLSDESGEFEFVTLPADGVGEEKALTDDGTILRFQGNPSPDGAWVAYDDNNNDLWLLNVESREQKVISTNRQGIGEISWSPDSRWMAFVQWATNTFAQIHLYNVESGSLTPLTSDRFNNRYSAWSPEGQWIYFLSDRNLRSVVGSPWGPRQPEPYFDKPMKLYQVSLQSDLRPPFRPDDELHTDAKSHEEDKEKKEKNGDDDAVTPVEIELAGIQQRVWEVPIEPGNYRGIGINEKALFWINRDAGLDGKSHLMAAKISNEKVEAKKVVEGVRSFEMSADGKKILVRKGDDLYVIDADAKEPSKLAEHKVDLDGWTFAINVREDWRQIFIDAWRMERDYFYDPGMHGVDWDGVRDKYLPLVDRVTTRQELSDLIGRFVGELSALHTSVRGGDLREGADDITVPALGARLERAADAGGYRIDYIYQSDPDFPDLRSPLADPFHGISEGDIIETVNGVDTLSVIHIGALLRNQEDKQVRLRIKPAAGGESRDVIVVPIDDEWSLRYRDWEYTRRLEVEEKSQGKIGYIHLRAMGSRDISAWYREFYPVFDRQAIVLDFRHNNGGNIDSIILEKLLRRAWFYWKDRVGVPTSNMQYAPRGHLVALCDQNTASDGEAVIEGFRRLGLGKIIGMRTWGGEIWLSSSNRLSDGGLARAPMSGVYADGEWLIEGHGVEPDMVVDNLPHATFNGGDAQLDAAIEYLLEEIRKDPREVPPPPPYPDKSFDYPEQQPGGGQS